MTYSLSFPKQNKQITKNTILPADLVKIQTLGQSFSLLPVRQLPVLCVVDSACDAKLGIFSVFDPQNLTTSNQVRKFLSWLYEDFALSDLVAYKVRDEWFFAENQPYYRFFGYSQERRLPEPTKLQKIVRL